MALLVNRTNVSPFCDCPYEWDKSIKRELVTKIASVRVARGGNLVAHSGTFVTSVLIDM